MFVYVTGCMTIKVSNFGVVQFNLLALILALSYITEEFCTVIAGTVCITNFPFFHPNPVDWLLLPSTDICTCCFMKISLLANIINSSVNLYGHVLLRGLYATALDGVDSLQLTLLDCCPVIPQKKWNNSRISPAKLPLTAGQARENDAF